MIIPGASYWNFGFGREKGEVENDPEGLRTMQTLGETLVRQIRWFLWYFSIPNWVKRLLCGIFCVHIHQKTW
jgi:hypothetical protein